MKQILALLTLIMSFSTLAGYEGKLTLLSAKDLLAQRDNFVVLDTRSAEEFAEGHIAGAINIPHTEVANQLARLQSIDKTIVVHCRSGRRALVAEQALLDAQFSNLKHLEGDIKGWVAQGLPLETKR